MKKLEIALRSFQRERKNGLGYAASWFAQRSYYRVLQSRWQTAITPGPESLKQPLTVVVPAVEKDALVLGHCLRSIREMVRHDLVEIWVVAPESPVIRRLAVAENARFVPEDTLLPRPARELKCRGWVLQQFIKFNAAFFVPTADYLVVDCDTVFLRPQVFLHGGKSVLRYSDQYELLYNRSLELIFGHRRRFPVSFVTHHMLMNVNLVKDLLRHIEQRFAGQWWEAILREVDKNHLISFSEFEIYGHFIMSQPRWRERFYLEYWHGRDAGSSEVGQLERIRAAAAGGLNTVSFHWHTQ